MMGDPEKTVDAAALVEAMKAEHAARRKRFKEEYALADLEAKTTILKYPIEVSTGVASFDGKPKVEKPRTAKANGSAAIIRPRVEPPIYAPNDLTKVPGVVGRLTDWMTSASLYPNRRLALGSSLVTLATVFGQRVATPEHGSIQVYVALLAPTAGGKQQPIDCGKEVLREAGAKDRIGSGDFRSSVALVNSLRVQSVFCSFIDEYGLVLQRLCGNGAGAYEQDLIGVAQQLWGLNWASYNSPASARQKSKQIFAPQFSICGVSTPQQFYKAVSSKEISGGLLNRHLILHSDERPALREREPDSWKLPGKLKEELREMYRPPGAKAILDKNMGDSDKDIDDEPFDPEIEMAWGVGAKQIWTDLCEKLKKETDNLRRDLFGRVAEMTIRFATIVAFGRHSLTVDRADMEWARALVLESAEGLHRDVLKYTVDMQDFPGLCHKIIELIIGNGGWMSTRDLKRRCLNFLKKGGDFDAAKDYLLAAERIQGETRSATGSKGGRPSHGYALSE